MRVRVVLDEVEELLETRRGEEVDSHGDAVAHGEVTVRVVEARDDGALTRVDHARRLAAQREHLRARAHGGDPVSGDRERLGARRSLDPGEDVPRDDQVRSVSRQILRKGEQRTEQQPAREPV